MIHGLLIGSRITKKNCNLVENVKICVWGLVKAKFILNKCSKTSNDSSAPERRMTVKCHISVMSNDREKWKYMLESIISPFPNIINTSSNMILWILYGSQSEWKSKMKKV